ncbi:hypothetical protein [Flavobacterium chilense]|uniref:hypothetical protein n=1 Tax=Flavobacterium chilense TaxID=946677 RepID=UPI000ADA4890|nr:hypothetical protein [Flavobacterium chilense]
MEIKRLFSCDPLPVKSSHAFSVVSSTGEPNCNGGPAHHPVALNTPFFQFLGFLSTDF